MKLIFPEIVEMGSSCFDLLDNSEPHVNMVIILYFWVMSWLFCWILIRSTESAPYEWPISRNPFADFASIFVEEKTVDSFFLLSNEWPDWLSICFRRGQVSTGTLNKLQFQFNLLSEEFTFHSNMYLVW